MYQVKSAGVVSTEEVWPALSVAPFWFQLSIWLDAVLGQLLDLADR
jgi:hypothetical protein